MERGVKLAMVVAAAVCLAAGLAWDRVISTVMDEPAEDVAAESSPASDPTSRMEFTFVGSLDEPVPPPAAGRSTPAAAGSAPSGSPDSQPVSVTMGASRTGHAERGADPLSPPRVEPAPGRTRERLHTVTSGERLGSISKKYFGTERYWRDIMTHNGIKDPKSLRPGQVLKIPDVKKD